MGRRCTGSSWRELSILGAMCRSVFGDTGRVRRVPWQRERGITSLFMHDVRDRGIRAIVDETLAIVGGQGPVFMSVDVDVLDPAYAPGTGTPESGGMTPVDLLWACRMIAADVNLVGADVVEVAPDRIGSRDITAHVPTRIVREILTGVAVRRAAR